MSETRVATLKRVVKNITDVYESIIEEGKHLKLSEVLTPNTLFHISPYNQNTIDQLEEHIEDLEDDDPEIPVYRNIIADLKNEFIENWHVATHRYMIQEYYDFATEYIQTEIEKLTGKI